MRRLIVVLCFILVFSLSGCKNSGSSATVNKATNDTNKDYEFTYYGLDNPEVTYDIKDTIKSCNYIGVVVDSSLPSRITDKAVDDAILEDLSKLDFYKEMDRKIIKSDDYLYVTRDGESKREVYSVAESGNKNINLLTSHKVGDTVTVTSEDNEIKIHIDSVVEHYNITDMSQLTDSWLSENTKYDSFDIVKAEYKEHLEAERWNNLSIECVIALLEASDIDVSDELIHYNVLKSLSELDYQVYSMGISSLDYYLAVVEGTTVDEYEEQLIQSYAVSLGQNMICQYVRQNEELSYTESDFKEFKDWYNLMGGIIDTDKDLKEYFETVYLPLKFIVDRAEISYED